MEKSQNMKSIVRPIGNHKEYRLESYREIFFVALFLQSKQKRIDK